MVKYCIGVDILNFPIHITHAIKKEDIIYLKDLSIEKKNISKNNKHFNMKNK